MATRANRAATGSNKRTAPHKHRDFNPAPEGRGRRHHQHHNEEREQFMLRREETLKRMHNVETGTPGHLRTSSIQRLGKKKAA